ncbi:hypothetical protein M413DRAFT_21752 [Hebeloma cylindrosporum]|uniref:F-box domain-containing protein n=1 Tax=Hebeloma cylindrosporum TaxID=76867 RepID=A0A0C3D0A6_HEBCY|nr:hypothetical protein M413DRAFT_21752 [Hebeloma cylindrosporum h7]
MPLDILFEIFGYLQPLDLLNLARTSKALRALLMTRSSLSVWKEVFLNVPYPHPPDCLGDLNEPQYTELLFGKTCTFCGKSVGKMHRVWAARVRVCTKCLNTHFEETDYFQMKPYGDELAGLIPTLPLDRKCGRHARGKVFVYPPIEREWLATYESIDSTAAKRRWVEDKVREQELIANHAEACTDWALAVQELIDDEKETAIEVRRETILLRIYELGWGDELESLSGWRARRPSHRTKGLSQGAYEAVLASLDEHLIAFMEGVKAKRLEQERIEITGKRLLDLSDLRDDSSFSEKVSFNDINQRWQTDIEPQLRDIASKGYKEDVNPETVLTLATTFFICKSCYSHYLRYPAVIMHRCNRNTNFINRRKDNFDVMISTRCLPEDETYWNNKELIIVKPEHTQLMASVVSMTGLDPKTATARDMDDLDPIYECVGCNDLCEGRAMMSWTTTLSHAFDRSVLLDESEAQLIRPRMRENRERMLRRYEYSDTVTLCAICKKPGPFMRLWLHLKNDHKKNPASGDDVPAVYSDQIPPVYRHWPPRDDVPVEDLGMHCDLSDSSDSSIYSGLQD